MELAHQLHVKTVVKYMILVKMFVLHAKTIMLQTILAHLLLHHPLSILTSNQTGQTAIGQN